MTADQIAVALPGVLAVWLSQARSAAWRRWSCIFGLLGQPFALRLDLHDGVQQAMQLEVQTAGRRAYSLDAQGVFGRRWRESAFIPIVTPSVVQLRAELLKHANPHATPQASSGGAGTAP